MANTISINGHSAIVNPTPLVSISTSPNQNKIGYYGSTHQITLTGAIVYTGNNATSTNVHNGPSTASGTDGLKWILSAQAAISAIFTQKKSNEEGLTVEIMNASGDLDVLQFRRCRVESITFEEGVYVNLCRYTIVLTSEALYVNNLLHSSSVMDMYGYGGETYPTDNQLKYMLEDFQETWDIAFDDQFGMSDSNGIIKPRTYTVTRTCTAVSRIGSQRPAEATDTPAWMKANQFLIDHIYESNPGDAERNLSNFLSRALLNFTSYNSYNHGRTVQVDKAAGSVTATDTWIVARGTDVAIENFEITVSSDSQSPYVKVSISGTIRGLTSWQAEDEYSTHNATDINSPANNASAKWNNISNNSNFGVASIVYKRANSATNVQLNDQPLSISISSNQVAGELSYSVEFDNRPASVFSNAVYESITVNDTYPGDQFAVIPVIGRATGPVLQFTFGRTEYKRSVNIEAQFDYSAIPYGYGNIVFSKPTMSNPAKAELNSLLSSLSPAADNNVRKYFLSPPQESWSRDGKYSLSLEWTYETND